MKSFGIFDRDDSSFRILVSVRGISARRAILSNFDGVHFRRVLVHFPSSFSCYCYELSFYDLPYVLTGVSRPCVLIKPLTYTQFITCNLFPLPFPTYSPGGLLL